MGSSVAQVDQELVEDRDDLELPNHLLSLLEVFGIMDVYPTTQV